MSGSRLGSTSYVAGAPVTYTTGATYTGTGLGGSRLVYSGAPVTYTTGAPVTYTTTTPTTTTYVTGAPVTYTTGAPVTYTTGTTYVSGGSGIRPIYWFWIFKFYI